jgi:hypothetical protein
MISLAQMLSQQVKSIRVPPLNKMKIKNLPNL